MFTSGNGSSQNSRYLEAVFPLFRVIRSFNEWFLFSNAKYFSTIYIHNRFTTPTVGPNAVLTEHSGAVHVAGELSMKMRRLQDRAKKKLVAIGVATLCRRPAHSLDRRLVRKVLQKVLIILRRCLSTDNLAMGRATEVQPIHVNQNIQGDDKTPFLDERGAGKRCML